MDKLDNCILSIIFNNLRTNIRTFFVIVRVCKKFNLVVKDIIDNEKKKIIKKQFHCNGWNLWHYLLRHTEPLMVAILYHHYLPIMIYSEIKILLFIKCSRPYENICYTIIKNLGHHIRYIDMLFFNLINVYKSDRCLRELLLNNLYTSTKVVQWCNLDNFILLTKCKHFTPYERSVISNNREKFTYYVNSVSDINDAYFIIDTIFSYPYSKSKYILQVLNVLDTKFNIYSNKLFIDYIKNKTDELDPNSIIKSQTMFNISIKN